MVEFENNARFWVKVDTLFRSSSLNITRKKGDTHPQFKNLIYPVEYGRLYDNGEEIQGLSVYVGSLGSNSVTALVVAVDILQNTLDIKILAGCNEEETENVLRFLNQTDYQKTVLMRRGNQMPDWGETEN